MKKILILANNDVGLYRFRHELIEELLKENEVVISCPKGDSVNFLIDVGCKFIDTQVDRRGINPKTDFKLFLNYKKIIKSEKPDLIITYTIKPNVYGGFAARLAKVPYAVNITGLGTAFQNSGILKKLVTDMYKISCKKAKTVFFENDENRQIFIKEKIVKEEQTCLLNGAGVNLEHFAAAEYPDGDVTRFIFIGRVMREKGIDELFSATKKLVDSGVACTLDILGMYEEDYKVTIDKYEKEGWLHYQGQQEDIRPFLKRAHCSVLPSWHEGMANTNLESAATARPIITSNIHGCKESVIDKSTGFLCEKQNSEDLYLKMKKFTGLSYQERKEMGLAGRKLMEEKFDKQKVVEKTIVNLFE